MKDEAQMDQQIAAVMEKIGQENKRRTVEGYRHLNQFVQPGKVLMVGSSLMEQFPINELLLDEGRTYTVYNRGIGGFTTQELEKVLDVCVYDVKPKHIFINIGTNDMNTEAYRLEGLLERYQGILEQIRSHLPEAGLTLMAYYPLCEPKMAQAPQGAEILKYRNNQVIAQANQGVEALAKKMGAGFVDCNGPLMDETGNLKAEYTIEGMHMYADGYAQVLKVLLPLLDQLAQ